MKILTLLPIVFLSFLLSACAQGDKPEPVEPPAAVAETQQTAKAPAPEAAAADISYVNLHTVGKIDPTVTKRLKNFIERNAMLAVHVADPIPPAGAELLQQADSAKGQLDPKAMLSILLSNEHKNDDGHAHLNPTNKIAVINVAKLIDETEETTLRRLERQTTKAIGVSLQLKPCPNPQCGMFPYRSLEELDQIGRGFCPPCQMFRDQAAEKMDVKLRVDFIPGRAPIGGQAGKNGPVPPAPPAPQPKK